MTHKKLIAKILEVGTIMNEQIQNGVIMTYNTRVICCVGIENIDGEIIPCEEVEYDEHEDIQFFNGWKIVLCYNYENDGPVSIYESSCVNYFNCMRTLQLISTLSGVSVED